MSSIKRVFKVFSVVEYKNIESYLEEMALKGWLFKEIKSLLFTFERVEPVKLKFNVVVLNGKDAFDYHDSETENTLKEFCEDSGWIHCAETPMYQIFYTDKGNDIVKIHTDEHEEYNYIKKTTFKSEWYVLPILLIMIYSAFNNIERFKYDLIFSNSELVTFVLPFVAVILFSNLLFTNVIWLTKNRINLYLGKPLTHFSNTFIKFKYKVYYLLMFIYFLLTVTLFANIFARGSGAAIPIFLILLLPSIAAILMIKRFKKVKKSRRSNIIMYIGVSVLVCIISIGMGTFSALSMSYGDFEEGLATDQVLEFSDFGEYKVVNNHIRKKSSIFTPVYLEYYESVRDKNSDIDHIETTYIECRNQKVVDYVVENILLDFKRYNPHSAYIPLSKEVWSIDQGYYLSDNKSSLLLVKGNRMMILRSDMDFEDIRMIDICKAKLDLD
jgi:hypothetical protein